MIFQYRDIRIIYRPQLLEQDVADKEAIRLDLAIRL